MLEVWYTQFTLLYIVLDIVPIEFHRDHKSMIYTNPSSKKMNCYWLIFRSSPLSSQVQPGTIWSNPIPSLPNPTWALYLFGGWSGSGVLVPNKDGLGWLMVDSQHDATCPICTSRAKLRYLAAIHVQSHIYLHMLRYMCTGAHTDAFQPTNLHP